MKKDDVKPADAAQDATSAEPAALADAPLQFKIEQIAICPKHPKAARALLAALGLDIWVEDVVAASGTVFEGKDKVYNVANLAFNYQGTPDAGQPLELEILDYKIGDNWMARRAQSVSHLGMHCTEDELAGWRAKFAENKIGVAQEVFTEAHSNPAIKDSRRYHYVVFNTRDVLGVDLKFIVRRDLA